MIEERHVDLIHAELDGELSAQERAELSRVLLSNPEARAFRDQLGRLFDALAKVESVLPPDDLTSSVLSALGLRDPSPHVRPVSSRWSTRPWLRYAAVFIGGVLVSTAALQLGRFEESSPDVSLLVGTIGGKNAAVRQSSIDRIQLELDEVSGTIISWRLDSQLVLELDLHAREPVEIVAVHHGQEMRFSLGTKPGAAPERVLWLPSDAGAAGAIAIEVSSGGRLLHKGTLDARAT